jgi:pimeloyl-ACP methyl ester carboxylesterase
VPYSLHKGVRIYYEVAGEGPPMLLLHPTPWDHSLWLYQIAHFSTWFRVIAVDSRCFGRSDKVRDPFPFEDVTDDILTLCEKESVKDAVVIGGSLGSRQGLMLGHKRPDLFKAICIVGTSAESKAGGERMGDKRRAERMNRYRNGPIDETYDWQLRGTLTEAWQKTPLGQYVVALMKERLPRLDGLAISRVFEASMQCDMIDLLPTLKVPYLVISGEHDRSVATHKAEAARIPDVVHRILPNTGHACPVEDPAGFDAIVIDYLTSRGLMPKGAA